MLLRKTEPKKLWMAGAAGLAIANLSMHYVHPPKGWGDMMDGVNGFLYGVSIALMLMVAWINGRRRRGDGDPRCA